MKFLPVTPDRWPDLEQLFEGPGGPNHCWCMVFRPMTIADRRAGRPAKKSAISKTVAAGTPVGILAYEGNDPVAWCSIAPIETYTNLRTRSYVSDGSDTDGVWSIACFYIRSALPSSRDDNSVNQCRDRVCERQRREDVIEAYPVDYDSPSYSYMGRIGTFERLGFKEIGMAGTRRHMMRLKIKINPAYGSFGNRPS